MSTLTLKEGGKMARITQQNKEETKSSIIKESCKLFIDLGYAKTNTKTIAQRCNIAEGTIFNYFATKDDILIAVFEYLSIQPDLMEISSSIHPVDIIIDILITPLRKLNRIPKQFVIDIIISAMKLSRKNNDLLHKLLAFDMSYIKKIEEKMNILLKFQSNGMNAKLLSEILYSTVATEYLLYTFDESMPFNKLESTIRSKLHLLIKPYL